LEVDRDADQVDYVVGVDPHRDAHAVAVVEVRTGAVVFEAGIAADSGGYAEALRLAERHAPGQRAFAIEGAGSFGAGLSRFLAEQGEWVFEVSRLRRERRSGGKTDALDAVRAARSALAPKRLATPRSAGEREALRALIAAREGAVTARTAALCQLRDPLVTTPEPLHASSGRSAAPGCWRASPPHGRTAARTPSCAARSSHSKPGPAHPTAHSRGTRARP
jgi:transposase